MADSDPLTDLDRRIAALSPERRALLELYLMQDNPSLANGKPIPRRNGANACPLSFTQQRLWFLEQLHPGSPVYHIPVAIRLSGPLTLPALQQSLDELLRRHEALRTAFPTLDGEPIQAVAPALTVELSQVDLQGFPEAEREGEARQRARVEAERPFDLARGPLFRATLLRLRAGEHILLLVMHHIVSDGWSMGVLFRELGSLYRAYSAGQPSPLPELPIQYADFALWQRQWLTGRVLEEQLSYWKQQLGGALAPLSLATDRPRPSVQRYRGARMPLALPATLTQALAELSQREGITLFMTLLAAFQTLLSRYSGQVDISVGTPIANRHHAQTEALIGFFANTLVMRTDLSGDPPFRELLRRVREVTLSAYGHQDVPFERLVEELRPDRDMSHTPLFQVMFALNNTPPHPLEMAGLTASRLPIDGGSAKFDLTLFLTREERGLTGSLEYNTDLFDAATIARMVGHFQVLLDGVIADPEQRLAALPLLTEGEQHQLLVEWNATRADYPRDQCIHRLFEEQVRRTPDAVALVAGKQRLIYRKLNARANQLAHHLQGLGVGPEVRVGLCAQRTPEMVVGLLGILKAGGAYVPLDPAYPPERLAFMVADSQMTVLVTQATLAGRLPAEAARTVLLDSQREVIGQQSEADPSSPVSSDHLAYVIYTSGSTGRPKGVAIEHRSTVALLAWARDTFTPGQLSGVLASTSLCFDLSVFELFAPLCWGGKVILAEDVFELRRLPAAREVTLINTVPSAMAELLRLGSLPSSVRTVNLAGEPLPTALVRQIYKQSKAAQIFDLYGPSEDTTYSTFALRKADGPATIGRPIANTQVYLLDPQRQPVPIGVPGELYLGGAGLARGYLNRPDLTAESFLSHPFSAEPGARLYRTGDQARYRPDGSLEFVGRRDQQVKIRGFRVELGEIEAALDQHPAVQEAVILAREDEPGERFLAAYIVTNLERAASAIDLRRFLEGRLPRHMVPATFTMLPALPLTANGKLDRQALPAPNEEKGSRETEFVAPRDPIELQLVTLWEKALRVRPIGVRDNFFDLGGHSLLAVRLVADLEQAFGRELPLRALFHAPTVEQLARLLGHEGGAAAGSSLVVVQAGGSRPPFFCISGLGGGVDYYRLLARGLNPDQPVYALHPLDPLRIPGRQEGRFALPTRIQDTAAHYLHEIRSVQPKGPYYLGGHSLSGLVAYELAQQLAARGEAVALLALFEPSTPGARRACAAGPKVRYHLDQLVHLKGTAKLRHLRRRIESLKWQAARLPYRVCPGLGARLPGPPGKAWLLHVEEERDMQAGRRYVPQGYPGQVTLFRSNETPREWQNRAQRIWESVAAGGLEIHAVPGDHLTMVEEPHIRVLAEQLAACLAKLQADEK